MQTYSTTPAQATADMGNRIRNLSHKHCTGSSWSEELVCSFQFYHMGGRHGVPYIHTSALVREPLGAWYGGI
jgi:hypothetical protein